MGKPASSSGTFLRELKRRKVFRVAAVYAIAGWLIIQIAQTVFPALHLPAWTVTFIVVLLIIGFPIALILAWAFELTPEGVKRTEAAEGELQEKGRKTRLRIFLLKRKTWKEVMPPASSMERGSPAEPAGTLTSCPAPRAKSGNESTRRELPQPANVVT